MLRLCEFRVCTHFDAVFVLIFSHEGGGAQEGGLAAVNATDNTMAPPKSISKTKKSAAASAAAKAMMRRPADDISLDGRSPNSATWGPNTRKQWKWVKMCPRRACGLEPQHCMCVCKQCQTLLHGLKRCSSTGCTEGADRSPEVETPPQESPPRPRLPSVSPPPSPPSPRKPWAPPSWVLRCPCEDCPPRHFRPSEDTLLGVVYSSPAYRAHYRAGVLPSNPLWGLTPAKRKEVLLLRRQEAEQLAQQQAAAL